MNPMKIVGALLAGLILLSSTGCVPVENDGKTYAEKQTEKRGVKKDGGSSPSAKPTKAGPKMTGSQENALASAEDYLSYDAFSMKGLIDQLKFEGYSVADATFAVNHLPNADWNQQAAASAKDYLSYDSFSRQGLIDQLKFEGFTQEQAVYGVSQTNLK